MPQTRPKKTLDTIPEHISRSELEKRDVPTLRRMARDRQINIASKTRGDLLWLILQHERKLHEDEHFVEVCWFGLIHSSCSCPTWQVCLNGKKVRHVRCPTPETCDTHTDRCCPQHEYHATPHKHCILR